MLLFSTLMTKCTVTAVSLLAGLTACMTLGQSQTLSGHGFLAANGGNSSKDATGLSWCDGFGL